MLTDDEKRELIAEARRVAPVAAFADGSANGWIRRLADALEGTLTEPDEEVCKALDFYRKNLDRSVRSNSLKQGGTRPKAANHRARWTPEEDKVLLGDNGLSLLEKAEALGRSYYAVERRRADLMSQSTEAVPDV